MIDNVHISENIDLDYHQWLILYDVNLISKEYHPYTTWLHEIGSLRIISQFTSCRDGIHGTRHWLQFINQCLKIKTLIIQSRRAR